MAKDPWAAWHRGGHYSSLVEGTIVPKAFLPAIGHVVVAFSRLPSLTLSVPSSRVCIHRGIEKMARLLMSMALCLAATSAFAQNCYMNGSTTNCDNGVSAYRNGNTTTYSDGTSAYSNGNTTTFSDGTSAYRNGNTTTYSNGVSAYTNGNTTTFSDGRTCYRNGSTMTCN
jgi:hypothetical protein